MTGTSQSMDALKSANRSRLDIASARRVVAAMPRKDTRAAVAAVIADPASSPLGADRVGRLLRTIPLVGDEALRKLLRHAGIPDGLVKVRDLTPRQRDVLGLALALPHAEQLRLRPRPVFAAGESVLVGELARLRDENRRLRWQIAELTAAREAA